MIVELAGSAPERPAIALRVAQKLHQLVLFPLKSPGDRKNLMVPPIPAFAASLESGKRVLLLQSLQIQSRHGWLCIVM